MRGGVGVWFGRDSRVLVLVAAFWLASTFLLINHSCKVDTGEPKSFVTEIASHLTTYNSSFNSSKLLLKWEKIKLNKTRYPEQTFNFNVSLSDSLPLVRNIPDTRPRECWEKSYDLDLLLKVSVIIPFYNEAISTLLRTMHGILSRTSSRLLEEIILVDDASSHDVLRDPLREYIDLLGSNVKVIRNWERQGLIRSRLQGLELATAQVVVFLDAHTEVNVGWLEPILDHLAHHPGHIVQPTIDVIKSDTMAYYSPPYTHRGTFTWDLRYVWVRAPEYIDQQARTGQPYWTTTVVGCALAVNRESFIRLGSFDPDQLIWGGENVELSFRAWMCGSQIVTLPCSRIGHLFRPTPYKKETPYHATWQKNSIRIAEVWMDQYKKYFYWSTAVLKNRRVNLTSSEWKSLEERIRLRSELKCKNFEWFLHNVAPDVPIPPLGTMYHGEILNSHTHACWEVMPDGYLGMNYICYGHKVIIENFFTFTKDGRLLYRDRCVVAQYPQPTLRVEECPNNSSVDNRGVWSMTFAKNQYFLGQIKLTLKVKSHTLVLCVAQFTSAVEPHLRAQMPQTTTCKDGDPFQLWSTTYRFDIKEWT